MKILQTVYCTFFRGWLCCCWGGGGGGGLNVARHDVDLRKTVLTSSHIDQKLTTVSIYIIMHIFY